MKTERSVIDVYLFPQLYRRLRTLPSLFSHHGLLCFLKNPSLSLCLVSRGNFMAGGCMNLKLYRFGSAELTSK